MKLKILSLLVVLFLIGCEAVPKETNTEIEFINAQVVNEPIVGCEYDDSSVCSNECCYYDTSCNGNSYRKCDHETLEWIGNYSDSSCTTECEKDPIKEEPVKKENTITEEDKQRTKQLIEQMTQDAEVETCIEDWVCINSSWKAYQLSDCSLLREIKCEMGCSNSKCNKICEEGALKCKANKLLICDDGYEWDTKEICEDGCESSMCIGALADETSSDATEAPKELSECNKDCIKLENSESNFEGSVNCKNNTYGEYVVFKNDCEDACNIKDWTLKDDSSTNLAFSYFAWGPGSLLKIITGKGTNTSSDIFFGRCSAVWNNDGDSVFLMDRNNEIVIEYHYP